MKATIKQDIFMTGKFRESHELRENREILLHVKFSCFTVSASPNHWFG